MYKKILIAVAPGHYGDVPDMIATARRLLAEGGQITLLSVVEQVPSYVVEYVSVRPERKIQEAVSKKLAEICETAPDVTGAVVAGNPGMAIPEYAEKSGADMILVSSHRDRLQEFFLGSTASRVVRRAPCTVMVLR